MLFYEKAVKKVKNWSSFVNMSVPYTLFDSTVLIAVDWKIVEITGILGIYLIF